MILGKEQILEFINDVKEKINGDDYKPSKVRNMNIYVPYEKLIEVIYDENMDYSIIKEGNSTWVEIKLVENNTIVFKYSSIAPFNPIMFGITIKRGKENKKEEFKGEVIMKNKTSRKIEKFPFVKKSVNLKTVDRAKLQTTVQKYQDKIDKLNIDTMDREQLLNYMLGLDQYEKDIDLANNLDEIEKVCKRLEKFPVFAPDIIRMYFDLQNKELTTVDTMIWNDRLFIRKDKSKKSTIIYKVKCGWYVCYDFYKGMIDHVCIMNPIDAHGEIED